jgi:hypothetical protein
MPLLQEVSNSKGKGKIDVYVNNLKGTPLFRLYVIRRMDCSLLLIIDKSKKILKRTFRKMIKELFYVTLISLLLSKSVLAQTIFFVSPKGKNSNAGTKEKPYASIDHAKSEARKVSGPVLINLLFR